MVNIASAGESRRLRNIVTGEVIDGKPVAAPPNRRAPQCTQFTFTVQPHSFLAFALE